MFELSFTGLPLRVGLILFVSVVSDHSALPHFSTGSGDAHAFGHQPATSKHTRQQVYTDLNRS